MVRAAFAGLMFAAVAYCDVSVDVRIGIGEYFRRPHREVIILEEQHVPPDEVPVVFFVADRARVSPSVVWELRRSGLGWSRIAARYHLTADVFYVPISVQPGPPYGNAYGHYRKRPRSQWRSIVLSDDDIFNLVNLRFYSEHYRVPADRIVVWRSGGGPFRRVLEVADREHWKEHREHEKDRREAWREWEKDRREAEREREKDQREAEREREKDQREAEREREKDRREARREGWKEHRKQR